MSSQLQSGFIQFQAVAHLLLSLFRVTFLVQWKFLANSKLGCKWNSFCNCIFLPKGVELRLYSCVIGWTLKNIHALWANFGAVSIFLNYKVHYRWYKYVNRDDVMVTDKCGLLAVWYSRKSWFYRMNADQIPFSVPSTVQIAVVWCLLIPNGFQHSSRPVMWLRPNYFSSFPIRSVVHVPCQPDWETAEVVESEHNSNLDCGLTLNGIWSAFIR